MWVFAVQAVELGVVQVIDVRKGGSDHYCGAVLLHQARVRVEVAPFLDVS